MESLEQILSRLSLSHAAVLTWYSSMSGNTFSKAHLLSKTFRGAVKATSATSSAALQDGSCPYVVSIRPSEKGTGHVQRRPDGSWLFDYRPRGEGLLTAENPETSAFIRTWKDRIPVVAIEQRDDLFGIVGLGLITKISTGVVRLEGFTVEGTLHQRKSRTLLELISSTEIAPSEPSPRTLADARNRVATSIVRRRGQPQFREQLLEAYGRRCAVTGCKVAEILEAAHIVPYNGDDTNLLSNGLLLRTDIHCLFDLGLIAIHPDSLTVLVASSLRGTEYEKYDGEPIRLPRVMAEHPNRASLRRHVLEFAAMGNLPEEVEL